MKLQIICRGSEHDGLGHLFRTKTFAKTAQKHHTVEIIAIVPKQLEGIFSDLACTVRFARTDEHVLQFVNCSKQADVLLFDLVSILGKVFLSAAKSPLLVASLSPIFEYAQHVDILFTRSSKVKPIPGVRIVGGLEYSIFSENCLVIGDIVYQHNLSLPNLPIAVCMGGADAPNKTLEVLRALKDFEGDNTIWVLLGEGYAHSYNSLVECMRGSNRHEIILAKTNRSTWHIMSNCAVAILAGGLTTIEAVYAGLPSINLFECKEHIDAMVTELFDLGVCLTGGLFSEKSLKVTTEILRSLLYDRERLWEMHKHCHGLIDTHGSERVLRELERQLETKRHSFFLSREELKTAF